MIHPPDAVLDEQSAGGPLLPPRMQPIRASGTLTRRVPTTCPPNNWPFLWSVDPQRGLVLNVPGKGQKPRSVYKQPITKMLPARW